VAIYVIENYMCKALKYTEIFLPFLIKVRKGGMGDRYY